MFGDLLDTTLRRLLRDSAATNDIDFKSDHRGVYAHLIASHTEKTKMRGQRRKKNTKDLPVEDFHQRLDRLVAKPPQDAHTLAKDVVAAAWESYNDVDVPQHCHRSQKLLDLLAARGAEQDPGERTILTRSIWMCLKTERK